MWIFKIDHMAKNKRTGLNFSRSKWKLDLFTAMPSVQWNFSWKSEKFALGMSSDPGSATW